MPAMKALPAPDTSDARTRDRGEVTGWDVVACPGAPSVGSRGRSFQISSR